MIAWTLLTAALGAAPSGTATVPLQDLLPLVTPEAAAAPSRPPVDALVVKTVLRGHLTPDALRVDAHFEVDVLADRWSRVPLVEIGPDVFPTELPTLDHATVAVHEGALCLLTRTPGRYALDVGLTVRSASTHGLHRATLAASPGALPAPLTVESDPALFETVDPGAGESTVYPRDGRWVVSWKSAVEAARPKVVVRPPLEPSISRASATWVSTLEGRATLRVRYALKVDRELALGVDLPPGLRLERAQVNGMPVEATVKDGHLELNAAPKSVGAGEGEVELLLAQELGVFHLSGQLRLTLPRASWPIAEVRVDAHLPAVFNYRRQGGSLEEVEASEGEGEAGLPGKALHLRQFLVSASAPALDLGYSVDMTKSYFH